jgi:hypothetical protein
MQELNFGFYPKVRFATALEEADSNRQFVADSTLEEAGFELLVPPSKRTAVPELAPSFFAPDCTGCDRFSLRE